MLIGADTTDTDRRGVTFLGYAQGAWGQVCRQHAGRTSLGILHSETLALRMMASELREAEFCLLFCGVGHHLFELMPYHTPFRFMDYSSDISMNARQLEMALFSSSRTVMHLAGSFHIVRVVPRENPNGLTKKVAHGLHGFYTALGTKQILISKTISTSETPTSASCISLTVQSLDFELAYTPEQRWACLKISAGHLHNMSFTPVPNSASLIIG